jgi:preprotein translocase subunit SecG
MTTTLLISQIVLAVFIIIAVLLQKSSSLGLGAYSGSNDSMFGAKGPANFLVRATFVLGTIFVLNTLALGYFYNQKPTTSAVDQVDTKSLIPPIPKKSTIPTAPKTK